MLTGLIIYLFIGLTFLLFVIQTTSYEVGPVSLKESLFIILWWPIVLALILEDD